MKIITIIFFILSSWHLLNFLFSRSLKSENKKNIYIYIFFLFGLGPGQSWAHLLLGWARPCLAQHGLPGQAGLAPIAWAAALAWARPVAGPVALAWARPVAGPVALAWARPVARAWAGPAAGPLAPA